MIRRDRKLHILSKNVSLPHASHHSRSFGIIGLYTLDRGTRLGYHNGMRQNKSIRATESVVGIAYIGRCHTLCRSHARLAADEDGSVGLLVHIQGEIAERHLDIHIAQQWSNATIVSSKGRSYIGLLRPSDSVWASGGLPMCIEHRVPLRFTKLKTRVTDRPCADDCQYAIGAKCECSCGGANHGMKS